MFTCVLFHIRVCVCALLIECVTLLCKTQTKPRDKHLIHISLRHSKSNIDKFCRQCETNALIKIKHNNRNEKRAAVCKELSHAPALSLSLFVAWEESANTKKKTQWQSDQSDRVREEERERREVYAPKWRGALDTGHWACKWREWGSSHTGRERERDEWMSWVKVKWLFATLSERVKLLCKNCRGNLHSDRTSMCTCVRARVCAYVHACSISFSLFLFRFRVLIFVVLSSLIRR